MIATLLTTIALGAFGTCHEDNRCWDWTTMGNHRRGVTLVDGTKRVVTARQFCRLYARAQIDWTKTVHNKRDPFCKEIAVIA